MLPSAHELQYFREVCITLNFSRAADRLGISQPTLSAAMKRLEQTIGADLFVRSKSGVSLTRPGQHLANHLKQMLNLWSSIQMETLASSESVQGSFVIGCHASVAQFALPEVIKTLMQQHPLLELHLHHALSRKILQGLMDKSIDIAIVVNPIQHDDLILQKLYDDTVGFWKTRQDRIQAQNPILIADTELLQTRDLLQKFEKQYHTSYRLISSTNLDVIAQLTASGCGWGILPGSVVHTHSKINLQPMSNMPTYHDEIYLAYRPEMRQIKAIQILTQALRKKLQTV